MLPPVSVNADPLDSSAPPRALLASTKRPPWSAGDWDEASDCAGVSSTKSLSRPLLSDPPLGESGCLWRGACRPGLGGADPSIAVESFVEDFRAASDALRESLPGNGTRFASFGCCSYCCCLCFWACRLVSVFF